MAIGSNPIIPIKYFSRRLCFKEQKDIYFTSNRANVFPCIESVKGARHIEKACYAAHIKVAGRFAERGKANQMEYSRKARSRLIFQE